MTYIVNLKDVNSKDIELVGGKNASTGEMIQNLSKKGIRVPGGFATTISAYKSFLTQHQLDEKISTLLSSLNTQNFAKLNKTSAQIRNWIIKEDFDPAFIAAISDAYKKLGNVAVAVRSSALEEDLAAASFAGAHETYLNIKGLNHLIKAIKLVFASYFTSRAIAYRHDQHFDHLALALSVGIQPMIRSDQGTSGVIFTLDTESGFDKVVLVTASYGLGESIVQGQVNPDEFFVYKPALIQNKFAILQRKLGSKATKMVYTSLKDPHGSIKSIPVKNIDRIKYCLTDTDVQKLAKQAILIEEHYGKPMDIEWAKDGITGELYILQARPETVKNQLKNEQMLERYYLSDKGKILTQGESIGQRIGHGISRVIVDTAKMNSLQPGEILVTDMTDPDWEPIMKRASAIVTNRGGRTCHAAIIARELGIPAIVGCGNATKAISSGRKITVSCAEGRMGYVYSGILDFKVEKTAIKNMPQLPVKLCLNVGNPDIAFQSQFLPNDGVGLARLEFIISNLIGVHPNAVLNSKSLTKKLQQSILFKTRAYKNPVEYYIEKLREGISMIAAAFFPKPVIFRFSDFKSNEYANLLGGSEFEPAEENPMIGFRGASRYYDPKFRECFALECQAFKRVRGSMGLANAHVMLPFVRTVDELKILVELMEKYGLQRGDNGLLFYMMCEIPSNALLAAEFLQYVDGFSIGSNDLTQLTLGLDRDSSMVAPLFDERNAAVKALLHLAITECKKQNKYIGICGQGPSDHHDFAAWLMQEGIEAISLNPDSIVETWLELSKLEVLTSVI